MNTMHNTIRSNAQKNSPHCGKSFLGHRHTDEWKKAQSERKRGVPLLAKRLLDEATQTEISVKYKNGMGIPQLSTEYGVSYQTIDRILDRLGIAKRSRKKITGELAMKIMTLYKNGCTNIKKLATEFKIAYVTMYRFIMSNTTDEMYANI